MPDQDAYVATLAGEFRTRRPDLLNVAEDELQVLRNSMRKVAAFLQNTAVPLDVRQNLAADLQLPAPEK